MKGKYICISSMEQAQGAEVDCSQALLPGRTFGMKGPVYTYIFTARYSELIKLFENPDLAVMTPEDEYIGGKLIEVLCPVTALPDKLASNVWYGMKGCPRHFAGDHFEAAPGQSLADFCWKCFIETIQHRSDLNLINEQVAECCAAHPEERCINCPCRKDFK